MIVKIILSDRPAQCGNKMCFSEIPIGTPKVQLCIAPDTHFKSFCIFCAKAHLEREYRQVTEALRLLNTPGMSQKVLQILDDNDRSLGQEIARSGKASLEDYM